jgi:3-hydroxybutyryl-CoA dehydrogenase
MTILCHDKSRIHPSRKKAFVCPNRWATMSRSEHIAVVGAGLMGHGIAQVFASKGHEVSLTDANPDALSRALFSIEENMVFLCRHGLGAEEDIRHILQNIRTTENLAEAVTGARFVIEAISEELSAKQDLFCRIESHCSPHTILATNTSAIRITEIAAAVERRERVVGTHFWNPPYLVPLVEVVAGEETSSEVMDYAVDLLKTAGKHPVKVKKDVPGFVGNRLQHALWREAVAIVDQGIADAATVDEVIKNSFGIRLPVLAPLETADMVGLDLTLQIHDYILRHIDRSTAPLPTLREKVARGELGFKTGKGFYEWDNEAVGEKKKALMEHLAKWALEHKDE